MRVVRSSPVLQFFVRWLRNCEGIAATEFSLLLPVLMTMLMGVFDMGYAILAAQKTIRASQVTADLVARHKSVSPTDISEAVEAGRLALVPFDTGRYGYDVISLEFDENAQVELPALWRETGGNMSVSDGFASSLDGLGDAGDGLIVVRVRYEYEPVFSGYLFGTMTFDEVAFSRPRNGSSIPPAS